MRCIVILLALSATYVAAGQELLGTFEAFSIADQPEFGLKAGDLFSGSFSVDLDTEPRGGCEPEIPPLACPAPLESIAFYETDFVEIVFPSKTLVFEGRDLQVWNNPDGVSVNLRGPENGFIDYFPRSFNVVQSTTNLRNLSLQTDFTEDVVINLNARNLSSQARLTISIVPEPNSSYLLGLSSPLLAAISRRKAKKRRANS